MPRDRSLARVVSLTLACGLLVAGLLRWRTADRGSSSGAAQRPPDPRAATSFGPAVAAPGAQTQPDAVAGAPEPAVPAPAPAARRRGARACTRALGMLAGIAAVAFGVQSWTIASTGEALGADVSVIAVPPGELELSSSGTVVRANAMKPGSPSARGELTLRNITAVPVDVRIRALPSDRALDAILQVDARSRERRVARSTLGALRGWSPGAVRLAARGQAPLELRVWLERAAGDQGRGVIADVTLEFQARPVRR